MFPSPKKVFVVFKKHYQEIPLIPVSKTPFQTLVAVMLSARTRDETTAKVCKELFKIAPTPQRLSKLPESKIRKSIYPVGFYKTKAKHLKILLRILKDEFDGEIPKDDPARIIQLTPYWSILRDSGAQWYARQFLVKYLRWGLNLNKKEIIELIDKYNAWSDYNPRITAYYVAKHFREGTAETKVRKPVRKATLKRYGII